MHVLVTICDGIQGCHGHIYFVIWNNLPHLGMPPSSPDPDPPDAKRYEQCVRVFTVFFSALAGFGLKRLADSSERWPAWEAWGCFAAALFLLLRFLFGSANHLWLDFLGDPPVRKKKSGKNKDQEMPGAMVLDCLFLTVIGTSAVIMCYRPDVSSFLEWNCWLGLTAAGVVLFDLLFRCFSKEKSGGLWVRWLVLNLLYAGIAYYYIAYRYGKEPGWWWPWVLASVSALFFLIDLGVQSLALGRIPPGDGRNKRYEQSARVPTVFFSMLMGFGLKRLADQTWKIDALAGNWELFACFVIALAFFMRILFGSANHLWLNFVKTSPEGKLHGWALLWDCFWLALIGLTGLILCYSKDVQFFAFCSGGLALGIVVIDLVDKPLKKFLTGQAQVASGLWLGWLLIDFLQALAGGALGFALKYGWIHSGGTLLPWLGGYALVGVILLLWDLRIQLLALNE
jgi:hypothetical protein